MKPQVLYTVCIRVSISFSKTPPLSFLPSPPPPPFFLVKSSLYIVFFRNLPSPLLKIRFFSEPPLPPHNMKFFHLLKVTGFLVKILQIKFLVVAEKKNFVFKVFYEKNCCPPEKSIPATPSQN